MQLRVGCEFQYESQSPTPALVLVEPHPDPPHRIVRESWETSPSTPRHGYQDLFGNCVERLTLPVGPSTLRYDAIVEVTAEPDPVALDAVEWNVEDLPDEVLVYTLASRYCLTESLSQVAWHLFGQVQPGWARVQAICDWIHENIRYGLLQSTPLTTAVDVYVAGGGMCRDFAHLAITFCRCLNIPARYVFGYMPDIGVTGPQPAMDFHAWFEVYLGDRWWTFDARFNTPRIGRIPVGLGRDAVDVAMVTTYGAARFRRMVVWTEEADAGTDDSHDEDGPGQTAQSTEGLVLGSGRSQAADE
jgi:transglutaminase-like putative cysteine protease